jgi:hypothetical protein
LWQFIDSGTAEEMTESGNARVFHCGVNGTVLRPDTHGPKLIYDERSIVSTDPDLAKDSGTGTIQLNERAQQQKKWRKKQQSNERRKEVKEALEVIVN